MKAKLFALFFATVISPMAMAAQVKAHVTGMVCGFCAQGITKTFKAKSEVSGVDVDLDNKVVTIDFKDGKNLADSEIETLLRNAGYPSEKIERH